MEFGTCFFEMPCLFDADVWGTVGEWVAGALTLLAIVVAVWIPLHQDKQRRTEISTVNARLAEAATTRIQTAIYPLVGQLANDSVLIGLIRDSSDYALVHRVLSAMQLAIPGQLFSALDASPMLDDGLLADLKECVKWIGRCQLRLEQVQRIYTSSSTVQSFMRGDHPEFTHDKVFADIQRDYAAAFSAAQKLLKTVDPSARIVAANA